MDFDALLANLRHSWINWKVNKNRIKFSCGLIIISMYIILLNKLRLYQISYSEGCGMC